MAITDPKVQQAIHDAWVDQQGWAAGFAAAAQGATFQPQPIGADIPCCNLFFIDPTGHTFFQEEGNGAMSLTKMQVSSISGTAWNAESFPASGPDVILPVGFSSFQVSASYSFKQPCEQVDGLTGKKIDDLSATGTGTISQSASDGQVEYQLAYNASNPAPLTITGVAITNTGSVDVHPDQSGGILGLLESWFGDPGQKYAVSQAVTGIFNSASFSAAMIALLNKQLTGGPA